MGEQRRILEALHAKESRVSALARDIIIAGFAAGVPDSAEGRVIFAFHTAQVFCAEAEKRRDAVGNPEGRNEG